MNNLKVVLIKQGRTDLAEEIADKNEYELDFAAIVAKVRSGELDTNAKIGAEVKKVITRQDKRDARALARKEARIDARKLARKSQ